MTRPTFLILLVKVFNVILFIFFITNRYNTKMNHLHYRIAKIQTRYSIYVSYLDGSTQFQKHERESVELL